jgi:hypothetical protein
MAMVHFATTIQFLGGQRVINLLRGQGCTHSSIQHGKLDFNVQNWNLFFPSNATIRSYLPSSILFSVIDE